MVYNVVLVNLYGTYLAQLLVQCTQKKGKDAPPIKQLVRCMTIFDWLDKINQQEASFSKCSDLIGHKKTSPAEHFVGSQSPNISSTPNKVYFKSHCIIKQCRFHVVNLNNFTLYSKYLWISLEYACISYFLEDVWLFFI